MNQKKDLQLSDKKEENKMNKLGILVFLLILSIRNHILMITKNILKNNIKGLNKPIPQRKKEGRI